MNEKEMFERILQTVTAYAITNREVISEEALSELNEQIWFLEEKCGIAPQGKAIPENNL